VLDDVVDEARVRRGIPSLHAATSVPFAIGIAGFVIARIHHSLHDAPAAIRDRVVATATALVEGQRRELQLAGRADLSMTQYYRVIEAKTASLFACAAAVGAIAAGAGPQQVRAAARYGREAGLAFQIVDDLLDYIGDETTLGKRPGTDLRASKATAPVLTLRARLPASERATLDHYLAIRERSEAEWDDGLAWIRIEIGRHGIVEGCLDQARSHVGRAVSAMGALPNADGRGLLSALTASLVDRHR
jgi:octaprenyl-diphosphate synthase